MAVKPSAANDFEPSDFIKIDDHAKEMKALNDRVECLEKIVTSQEGFSDAFCRTFDRDVKMRNEITKGLSDFIKTDATFQKDLSGIINKIDRGYLASFFGKAGFAAWTLFIAVLIGTLTQCGNNYVNDLHEKEKAEQQAATNNARPYTR